MKTQILTTLMLISFILATTIPGSAAEEWYQGQPGKWHKHGHGWTWKGTHGDEWYEGKRGHWYAEKGGGNYWLGDDGREYRQGPNGWRWSGERHRRE